MHLEEALERLQVIITEIEGKQLPLHEVMKLHEEGQQLVSFSENLLKEAKGKLKVTEISGDADQSNTEPQDGEGDLF